MKVKEGLLFVSDSRHALYNDDDIECIYCQRHISEDEYNSWDEKYKDEPMCENCYCAHSSE